MYNKENMIIISRILNASDDILQKAMKDSKIIYVSDRDICRNLDNIREV